MPRGKAGRAKENLNWQTSGIPQLLAREICAPKTLSPVHANGNVATAPQSGTGPGNFRRFKWETKPQSHGRITLSTRGGDARKLTRAALTATRKHSRIIESA